MMDGAMTVLLIMLDRKRFMRLLLPPSSNTKYTNSSSRGSTYCLIMRGMRALDRRCSSIFSLVMSFEKLGRKTLSLRISMRFMTTDVPVDAMIALKAPAYLP